MKSTSSFLSLNQGLPSLIGVDNNSRLQRSFPQNRGQVFSSPALGNLSLCDRKLLRADPTQAISPWGALGKTFSVTAPKVCLLAKLLLSLLLLLIRQLFAATKKPLNQTADTPFPLHGEKLALANEMGSFFFQENIGSSC